jgi:ATP-dependent protease HslVU (ClpYQ) peptidase subunit
LLIYQQKVTIKFGGATIHADNPKLPDMLRKKSERGKDNDFKKAVSIGTEDEVCKGYPARVL